MMGAVSENERATLYGFTYTAWGVAVSLGTLIGGELLGEDLLTIPFVAAVISYLFSSAALRLFFGKVKPPEEVTRFSMPRISE
jgi:MFS family permease